jgi:beta-galactosidase
VWPEIRSWFPGFLLKHPGRAEIGVELGAAAGTVHGMGLFRYPLHCVILMLAPCAVTSLRAAESVRERVSLDADWRFTKGDPAGTDDQLSYAKLKPWLLPSGAEFLNAGEARPGAPEGNPGADVAYTRPDCDDTAWRALDLPHDWGIEGPFAQENPGETGKLPWWGVAWYRKHFAVPAEDAGKRVYLEVDGAMAYSAVWLNGHFVGGWPYGYASWRLDLTPFLKTGGVNVLAIRLDNPPLSSRWYPGGGIYRNVWLLKTAPVHVAHWGTFVTTPLVTTEAAQVDLSVSVQNDTAAETGVQVSTEIFALDANGGRTGTALAAFAPARPVRVAASHEALFTQSLSVRRPRLWSVKDPQRYVAVTTVLHEGKVADVYETPFGIRTLAFDPVRGFLLNGERLPVRGVCDHHDLGALGAAINVRALERQLEILREMGCNAIRTSHNPPAPELLELCDRMGFVVMDEAFDAWHSAKKPNDYSRLFFDWHEQDLRALVRRDRNHPCVVWWSIGNEVREQGEPEGWKFATHLAAIVHEEDRTRPVTSACNNMAAGFNGFQTGLDVMGFNYAARRTADTYEHFRVVAPLSPMMGSETSSCVSSRGEYFFPVSENKLEGRADFQVSSYDLYAPPWALPPDAEFKSLDQFPYIEGEFVWTGFDYLGEPTPYNADTTNLLNFTDPAQQARVAKELGELKKIRVPSRSSYFGIIDLAGFKKDRFFIYQARWRPELPMAHLLPHWTWPDRVGQVTPVHVYTSGDEAELFLNGQSLGRKKRGAFEYRLRWDDVKYQPGELRVVAYKNGARWAEDVMRTAGEAAKLTLAADRAELRADGRDLAFVTLTVTDANGIMVPRAKNRVKFEVSGPADLIATDNGDATSFESFQAPERAAYNGLALAIVRTRAGASGPITVRATSEGLQAAEVVVRSGK